MVRSLWVGRPWILPMVLARSIGILFVAIAISWLEFFIGIAFTSPLFMPIILWTVLAVFVSLIFSIARPLLLRASNSYILREDGLEIRAGILTSKAFVISSSGFSDLEVVRSISERIVGSGDIIIRTQGDSDVKMEKVRSPLKVAAQIREVMARPFVRIEGAELVREQQRYSTRISSK
jgi:uncharacterized membrane protein YdbT with pleckstrin-like domain